MLGKEMSWGCSFPPGLIKLCFTSRNVTLAMRALCVFNSSVFPKSVHFL